MQLRKLIKYSPELLSLILLSPYFFILSSARIIARDEGFYLMAMRMIREGKEIYSDFFYPQMPFLPYFYEKALYFFDINWNNTRVLTAILATTLGVLIVNTVRRRIGVKPAAAAFVLYGWSNFALAWYSVSQTYLLSTIFLFITYLTLSESKQRNIFIIIAGISFGLAVQSRLFFAGLLPILLLYIFFQEKSFKKILIFIASCLLSATPSILLLIRDYDVFYFNNLGYHLTRSTNTLAENLNNKAKILGVITGFRISEKFAAWQLPLLVYSSLIIGLFVSIKHKLSLAFLLVLGLIILNFLPNPSYVQYFATIIPFAILSTLHINKLVSNRSVLTGLALIYLTVYAYDFKEDLFKYTTTGEGVIGINNKENAKHWSINNLKKITDEVNQHCDARKTILSYWPGYTVESKCKIFPGTENHFGVLAASRITAETANRYKIISKDSLKEQISLGTPNLILLGKHDLRRRKLIELIETAGYRLITQKYNIHLYTK